jgi:flagellar motility protein MotE (MotC chaperone)
MSEYLYYEYRAVDRPLTHREIRELRALSTRAEITATSFINAYEWGDFKGDPNILMEKYFDAFVCTANGCVFQLVLRLPRRALDTKDVAAYCVGKSLRMRKTKNFTILEFISEDEGRDWEDSERWMDSLMPLRADLMRGDLRALYLGWLFCLQNQELSPHATEPPVPPGLAKLTAPLQSLAHFLGLDGDMIKAAAERSRNLSAASPSRAKLAAWIAAMPEAEKNALLLGMAEDNDSCLRIDLLRRFNQYCLPPMSRAERADSQPRTVSQIMALAQALADQKIRREAERKAAEQEKQELARTAARLKYLDKLAGREAQIWELVEALAQTKQPNNYHRAVSHVVDLRDLASRRGQQVYFDSALERLRMNHRAKPTFLRRLSQANL